jgi:hypothetical protein
MRNICIGDRFYTVECVSPGEIEGSSGKHVEPINGFGGKILINNNLHGHLLLDTFVHEVIHSMCEYLDEGTVSQLGTSLATALIQAGFVARESLCPGLMTQNSTKQ